MNNSNSSTMLSELTVAIAFGYNYTYLQLTFIQDIISHCVGFMCEKNTFIILGEYAYAYSKGACKYVMDMHTSACR